MPKLIITVDDTVDDLSAAYYVMKVIQQGRISESRNGRCYCFATTFKDGGQVLAERTAGGADTFRVANPSRAKPVKP